MEERNRVKVWETGSGPVAYCQKWGQMIPAHWLASRTDEFIQTLTRPSRSDPGQFYTVWPMPSLEKRMREAGSGIYTIRPNSGCTLAIMTITGHNQNAPGSDLAC